MYSFLLLFLFLTQESPVPLLKYQMAPRIKILMSCRSKATKGTQIYFPFLSKVPADEPPPGSQTGPLWREIPVYSPFCISLENLIKIPLYKKAQRKKCPIFPKSGATMEADVHFRALLLPGSPLKEISPKVPYT